MSQIAAPIHRLPWRSRRIWIRIDILMLCLLLSACRGSFKAEPVLSTSTPVQSATPAAPAAAPGSQAHAALSDETARDLMYTLSDSATGEAEHALERITAAGDTRFIAVLIELLRAAQIGLVRGIGYTTLVDTLEALSDQPLGDDWPAWIEWYGSTGLVPPPGFTGWKGHLLAGIDPGFGEFLQDGFPTRIRVEEIVWGGVQVDGIPALDNPTMIPASQASYLEPGEPVFGIAVNGDARAYPLRILDWHEMANDVVGGVPLSLAYCTLCGSGIAFDGGASDGHSYQFGSSGLLYRSNKLMYDRQTHTLWNQISGEPVLGELAGRDVKLSLLPVVLTSWSGWLEQHPDTLVLALETGHERLYELGAAYGDYFSGEGTMFPVWQRSQELPAKARVYALHLEGIPKAYSLERLAAEQVVNDTVGDTPVVLVARRGTVQVEGENLQVGPVSYDSGGEVRAYLRGQRRFSPAPERESLLDEQGKTWRVTEEALLGPDGETLPRLGGHLAYWFGWYAFFPKTQLYK